MLCCNVPLCVAVLLGRFTDFYFTAQSQVSEHIPHSYSLHIYHVGDIWRKREKQREGKKKREGEKEMKNSKVGEREACKGREGERSKAITGEKDGWKGRRERDGGGGQAT